MIFLKTFQRDASYDSQTYSEDPYQQQCGTIEDCFDLPCPRYGWRVKITYVKECPYNLCPENDGFTGRLSDPVCQTQYNL